jgi:dTDP-4-amino-4,6-dideoxygalactose transaminase
MSNVVAGIGRGQMEVIEDRVKARRRVHDFYITLFEDVDGIEVLREPDERFFSNMWLTTITIDSQVTGFTREDLRLRLLEDNIESRPLWKPMHLQPVFNEYPYYGSNVAEKLFINGLCLPSGSNMSEQDLERIKHCIMQEINTHV